MLDFVTSYQFLAILGLFLDIIAINMMFYKPGEMTFSGYAKRSPFEKWGIRLLLIGFGLQLISSIWSYCI